MSDDDDLLRKAQDETSSYLSPGSCCEKNVKGLRYQIINLLNCEACQDMKFQVGNILITGSMYKGVAYALMDPGHKVHLSYRPAAAKSKYDASYDPAKNRLYFPFNAIGGKVSDLSYQCQTIIHECTHACVDLAHNKVSRLNNEVAGWFAGVLFLRGQNLPFDDKPMAFLQNLSALAEQARMANVKGKSFTVPTVAMTALRSAIQSAYGQPDLDETGDGF